MTYTETTRVAPNIVESATNTKKGVIVCQTNREQESGTPSAHVLIGKDGLRTILADDDAVTMHADSGKWRDMRPNPSHHTLGVEFELTAEDVKARAALTADQIESFKEWLRPRWRKYGWKVADVTNRAAVDPEKIDLSDANWSLVKQAVEEIDLENGREHEEDVLWYVRVGAFPSEAVANEYAVDAREMGLDAAVVKGEPRKTPLTVPHR